MPDPLVRPRRVLPAKAALSPVEVARAIGRAVGAAFGGSDSAEGFARALFMSADAEATQVLRELTDPEIMAALLAAPATAPPTEAEIMANPSIAPARDVIGAMRAREVVLMQAVAADGTWGVFFADTPENVRMMSARLALGAQKAALDS